MDREIRSLLFEIIFIFVIIVVFVPLFIVFSSENVSAREKLIGQSNSLQIELIYDGISNSLYQMSDEDAVKSLDGNIIKVSNMCNDNISYDLIFKMSKVSDYSNYSIMFNGNIFNLEDLKYIEDDNYRYFSLDNFVIQNKEQYFTFLLWVNNENNNFSEESFNYSYMIKEV